MDESARDELLMVASGLFGIVAGHVIRRKTLTPEQRSRAQFGGIGVSSLVATPALARVAGEVLQVERDDVRAQASLTFATGALLTFFAEDIARFLPGMPVSEDDGQP